MKGCLLAPNSSSSPSFPSSLLTFIKLITLLFFCCPLTHSLYFNSNSPFLPFFLSHQSFHIYAPLLLLLLYVCHMHICFAIVSQFDNLLVRPKSKIWFLLNCFPFIVFIYFLKPMSKNVSTIHN